MRDREGTETSADVLIVGGGPAGCAAAIALRQRKAGRVIVVDDGARSPVRIGESIPPDSRLLLEQLGAWSDFAAQGHAPCVGSRSSWGSDDLGYNDFVFNVHGPGWHLDRMRFDAMLLRAAERSGATVLQGTRLKEIRRSACGAFEADVSGATQGQIGASVVIDASGGRRVVAHKLGAVDRVHDRLLCIAAFFDGHGELGGLSLLEAVACGWWYAAALPDGRSIVMLATDSAVAKDQRLADPTRWLTTLESTQHVMPLLGHVGEPSQLFAKSAPSSLLNPVCGPGWLAVGDAASLYDPLSAQGVYKALATGYRGGCAVADALGGKLHAVGDYSRFVIAGFEDFQRNHRYLYDQEARWPESPFWKRRRAPGRNFSQPDMAHVKSAAVVQQAAGSEEILRRAS